MLIGIAGLRWSDVSAAATPALWRLAQAGLGRLPRGQRGRDPHLPGRRLADAERGRPRGRPAHRRRFVRTAPRRVSPGDGGGWGIPGSARVPRVPSIASYNAQFHYDPQWGLLGTAAGPGRCATAVGPGAALALTSKTGQVSSYLPAVTGLTRPDLARCPLTVVDLGALKFLRRARRRRTGWAGPGR